jgi:hypothetical protein
MCISAFILSPHWNETLLFTWLILFFCYFYGHGVHILSHVSSFFPFNLHHVYHHSFSLTWISDFLEIMVEIFFMCILPLLFSRYIASYLIPELFPKCEWVIVFYCIWYMISHNVNYSIFKVNDTHKLHHLFLMTNFGIDYVDTLFQCKQPYTKAENMNHYLPVFFITTLLVLLLKFISNSPLDSPHFTPAIYEIFFDTFLWGWFSLFLITTFILFAFYIEENKRERMESFHSFLSSSSFDSLLQGVKKGSKESLKKLTWREYVWMKMTDFTPYLWNSI